MIKFRVDDTLYEFDETRLLSAEAMYVKKNTGLTLLEFLNGIQLGEPGALTGMVYIAKRRVGEYVKWAELDELDLMELLGSIGRENGTPPTTPPEPEPSEPESAPEPIAALT